MLARSRIVVGERWRRTVAALVGTLCIGLGQQPVLADAAELVIVQVTRSSSVGDALDALVCDIHGELNRRNISALSAADALDRFESRHSRIPAQPSEEDVAKVVQEAQAATLALVQGRGREVLVRVERVRAHVEPVLAPLNRDARARKAILETCVAGIQAHVHDQQPDRATDLGSWCLSSLPDLLTSSNVKVPSPVQRVLEEAAAELRESSTHPLTIESEPSGCTTFVQGRQAGPTPYVLEHPTLRPYTIEVDCGATLKSRSHTVSPGTLSRLLIDVRFDQAVESGHGQLRLRYADRDDALVRAHTHRIATIVGANAALAVSSPAPNRLSLRRVHANDGASVDIPFPYTHSQLQAALDKVLDGKNVISSAPRAYPVVDAEDLAAPGPTIDDAPAVAPVDTLDEEHLEPRWKPWTGATLGTAGIGAMVAGAVLTRKRARAGERFKTDPFSLGRETAWRDLRKGPYLASGLGALAASTGVVLLGGVLDPENHIWLPITTAALGVGAIVVGAIDLRQAVRCQSTLRREPRCIEGEQRTDRGAQLLFGSLPFVSFSLAQFVRWALPPELDAHLEASPSEGRYALQVRAAF